MTSPRFAGPPTAFPSLSFAQRAERLSSASNTGTGT